MTTPGPFILRQNMGAHALFRRLSDEAVQYVGALSNGLDEAERDELVGLLNKGTHFGRLLEALELAERTLGERHWGDIAKARVKAKAARVEAVGTS